MFDCIIINEAWIQTFKSIMQLIHLVYVESFAHDFFFCDKKTMKC